MASIQYLYDVHADAGLYGGRYIQQVMQCLVLIGMRDYWSMFLLVWAYKADPFEIWRAKSSSESVSSFLWNDPRGICYWRFLGNTWSYT